MNKCLSILNKALTKHQRSNSLLGKLSEPRSLLQGVDSSKATTSPESPHQQENNLYLQAIWPLPSLATVTAYYPWGGGLVILLSFRNFLRFVHYAYFLNLVSFIYFPTLNEAPSRSKDFNSEEIAASLIISLFFMNILNYFEHKDMWGFSSCF